MDDLLSLEWPPPASKTGPSHTPALPSHSQKPGPASTLPNLSNPPFRSGSNLQASNANLLNISHQKPNAPIPSLSRPSSSSSSGPANVNLRPGQAPVQTPTLSATSSKTAPAAARGTVGLKHPGAATNDSFAGLLSIGGISAGGTGANSSASSKSGSQLSLQERQRMMQEEKRKEMQRQADAFAGIGEGLWDGTSGTGSSKRAVGVESAAVPTFSAVGVTAEGKQRGGVNRETSIASSESNPPQAALGTAATTGRKSEDLDDILAAFNSSAPVDASSHLPPPKKLSSQGLKDDSLSAVVAGFSDLEISRSNSHRSRTDPSDLDDFITFPAFDSPAIVPSPRLGARSRNESPDGFVHVESPPPLVQREEEWVSQPQSSNPRDRAVAELVDMGFEASVATAALEQTASGCDVSAAVGIILNQVHAETRARSGGTPSSRASNREAPGRGFQAEHSGGSGAGGEYGWAFSSQKDPVQIASELGSNLMKSANSLWKVGQKHLKQAVAEFQVPPAGSAERPRWMNEGGVPRTQRPPHPAAAGGVAGGASAREGRNREKQGGGFTDEALMLEIRDDLKPADGRKSTNPFHSPSGNSHKSGKHAGSYKQRLTREEVEKESMAVYTSSARRRPVTKPRQQSPPPPEKSATVTLFDMDDEHGGQEKTVEEPEPRTIPDRTSKPARPSAPAKPSEAPKSQRQIPAISPQALSQSCADRLAGNESFKKGDFDTAHTLFGKSLAVLPAEHPLRIVVWCNRAAAALKIGDAKGAITDADAALALIGPRDGKGEHIEVWDGDGGGGASVLKDMNEYFGRALHRKAQALEQMEKWDEAADVWQRAIEGGVGGAIGMAGRNRCIQTAGSKRGDSSGSKPKARPNPGANSKPAKPGSASTGPATPPSSNPFSTASATTSSSAPSAAVTRLRAADQKAAQLEEEKFQLRDQVDATIAAWAGQPGQGGKGENLRALLASLDKVLWPDSGWKGVGMAGLVVPQKVKVWYMRALTVVHPDKLPSTATAEQQMLAGSVFAILNSAWDKFKTENGM